MNNIIDKLRLCVDEHEVWELLKDEKLHPEYDALFGDDPIMLPNHHRILCPANLPKNHFGLMARVVSYLRFRGFHGPINYGGGVLIRMQKYQTIWNDLLALELVDSQEKDLSSIDNKALDRWLSEQTKSFGAASIHSKVTRLNEWQALSNKLPRFLTSGTIQNHIFPDFKELEDKVKNEQPDRQEGKEKYPLFLMLPILKEAINNLENYTDDIMLLMENQAHLNDTNIHSTSRMTRIKYFFRDTTYLFKEPRLMQYQELCKSFKASIKKRWNADAQKLYKQWKEEENEMYDEKPGPRRLINDAVRRWIAANVIILGIFSGGRSQEIVLQPRNIRTPKTRYHELDKGFQFTRIIWKTEKNGKLLQNPMPPLGIKAYHNLSRFSELFDGKHSGELILEDFSKSGKRTRNRMYFLLQYFSVWVHGKDELRLQPHQLRHAIASLVTRLNERNGLMIAAKLLGHRSANMTMEYEAQLKNIIVNQMQYMADTSEKFKEAMQEYNADESLLVFNEKIKPNVAAGEKFYGNAKEFVEYTGEVVNNIETWFQVIEASLTSGEYGIIDCGTHICVHSLKNRHQMACQRGFNLSDYTGVPLQPVACVGSSCANALYTEEQAKAINPGFKSIRELAPKELQEMAKEWFIAVADNIPTPDLQIYEEYKADQQRKYKEDSEAING